jgi:hypothetical protein
MPKGFNYCVQKSVLLACAEKYFTSGGTPQFDRLIVRSRRSRRAVHGVKARLLIEPEWLLSVCSSTLDPSHNLISILTDADAQILPSGEKLSQILANTWLAQTGSGCKDLLRLAQSQAQII